MVERQLSEEVSSVAVALTEPPTRRRHTKSRKGCGNCKRRKIKCDERKPDCARCAKRGVECDFPRVITTAAPASDDGTPLSQPLQLVTGARLTSNQTLDQMNHQSIDVGQLVPNPSKIPNLEIIHLELLFNYTTSTSQSLATDPILRNIWRVNVPEVAFSHDCVMRSIFALSALHKFRFSNRKRQFYLDHAQSEHGAALHEIASTLSNVTAENCSAVYIAAALTFIYVWASPGQMDDFRLVGTSGTAEWVFLLKGVRSVVESWWPNLSEGPFGPMLQRGRHRIEHWGSKYITSRSWQSSFEHAQLKNLRRMTAEAAKDAHVAETYDQNITHLETCFGLIFHISCLPSESQQWSSASSPRNLDDELPGPKATSSDVYSWLYKMTDHFIDLLGQRDPPALVIFAHSCVLLSYMGSYWWMDRCALNLFQEIWDLLDEEHRLWIRWPMEETGWIRCD